MEEGKRRPSERVSDINDFSSNDVKTAPMKYDGKEIRGISQQQVIQPPKKSPIVPIAIVAVIVVAIIIVVVVMNGNKGSDDNTGDASTQTSTTTSTTTSAPAESKAADDKAEGIVIKLQKPEKWDDDVYAYIFSDGGTSKNDDWPGKHMKNEGNGIFSYVVPDDIENPHVVFNCKGGNRQYPKTGGLKVENGKTYTIES